MRTSVSSDRARPGNTWVAALLAIVCAAPAAAQPLDCNRLAAQIASYGRDNGGQDAAAAQKQGRELARTQAYASSIGCDRPQFFGFGDRPPQCDAINARIARMQANVQGLQSAYGGSGRAVLQQRFDTYCRGAENYGTARNFFDRLFDTRRQDRFGESYNDPPPEAPQTLDEPDAGELRTARGGSQALCVRTCDGGYFPLGVSMRARDPSEVQNLCSALCPGTEAKLYTRVPGGELSTAVSLDGVSYSDLPNALKFQKTFDKTCTCKPAGKSWGEALVDAERLLGEERKGDILVTPEKAEELSRSAGPVTPRDPRKSDSRKSDPRKFDPRAIAKTVGVPLPEGADPRAAVERQKKISDEAAASEAVSAASAPTASMESSGIAMGSTEKERVVGRNEGVRAEAPGPDGRRKVRIIGQ